MYRSVDLLLYIRRKPFSKNWSVNFNSELYTAMTRTKPTLKISRSVHKSGLSIRSGIDIQIPQGTISANFSDNLLIDFLGIEGVQSLETLLLDGNPIVSFRGFPEFPSLRSLSLANTPISLLSNFRALAVACAGPTLVRLNGIDVSAGDQSAANAYGPRESVVNLLRRGWLPRKPINLFPTSRPALSVRTPQKEVPRASTKGTPRTAALQETPKKSWEEKEKERQEARERAREKALEKARRLEEESPVLRVIAEQENDPDSLRLVRVLRAVERSDDQIKQTLRAYFAPPVAPPVVRQNEKSSFEQQLENQAKLITTLATEIAVLRTGNQVMNQYEEMVNKVGAPLLRNAEELAKLERGEDYAELRAAVVEVLNAREDADDDELIALLDEALGGAPEEEEEAVPAPEEPTLEDQEPDVANVEQPVPADPEPEQAPEAPVAPEPEQAPEVPAEPEPAPEVPAEPEPAPAEKPVPANPEPEQAPEAPAEAEPEQAPEAPAEAEPEQAPPDLHTVVAGPEPIAEGEGTGATGDSGPPPGEANATDV
jgi:hypothetical protein